MTNQTKHPRRPAVLTALFAVLLGMCLMLLGGPVASASGETNQPEANGDQPVELTLFWGDGCPNCAALEDWFESDLLPKYPNLTIARYEVWNSSENRDLFAKTAKEKNFDAVAVPTTILQDRIWIGFTTAIMADMDGAISRVSQGQEIKAGVFGDPKAGTCNQETGQCYETTDGKGGIKIDVPLFGQVDLGSKNLLVSTVIIGFVDGINPCSLWVITVLLTIVIRTGSRPRVIAIGAVFLTITTIMYALYMIGIYSALGVMGHLGQIQMIVGLIAGIFGLFALKDYFAFKRGPSLTISDSAKPGLYTRMRNVAGKKALLPALGATAVLAVLVSLLETPCTAGFPVIWTGMLRAHEVSTPEAVLLFIAYMIPFLLDELAIFTIAIITMKATKMQEKHGQLLKLVAGVTMLAMAAVMFTNPGLMENPLYALGIFAGAFGLAAIIHLVTVRVKSRDKESEKILSG